MFRKRNFGRSRKSNDGTQGIQLADTSLHANDYFAPGKVDFLLN